MDVIANFIRGDIGVAVAATVYQPEKKSTLVHCINVTAQHQELRAGSLLDLFMPLEICEGGSGSH